MRQKRKVLSTTYGQPTTILPSMEHNTAEESRAAAARRLGFRRRSEWNKSCY